MIAATITPPTGSSSSLRTLINDATPGQIPSGATGRVYIVALQWVNGSVFVQALGGSSAALEQGHFLDSTNRLLILEGPSGIPLSLDDIYLSGTGSPSVRVAADPQAHGVDLTPFSPIPLANLALWLKADAITGLVNNDPVATWVDSSGTSNNATQGTGANQPIYKTGILNGLPIARFDGSNDGMVTTNNVFTAKPFSFFVVYMGNSNLNNRRCLQSTTVNWTIAPFQNTWRYFNGTDNIVDGFVAGAFRFHTVIQTGAGAEYWINGVSQGTALSAGANPGIIALGFSGGFVEFLDGDIAENMGYTANMSTRRVSIES